MLIKGLRNLAFIEKTLNYAFDLSNNVFDLTDIALVLSNIVVVLTYTPSPGHFNSVLEKN